MGTKTVTAVNNAQVDTAQKKFGTGSLLLDGIDDELTVPNDAAWNLGTGKFTIDCWIRPADSNSNVVCGQVDNGTNFWGFVYNSSANTITFGSITAGTWDVNFSIPATLNANTWYHVAVVRDGTTEGTWHMFLDGVEGTKTLAVGAYSGTIFNGTGTFKVGTLDGSFANDNDGWIDEFRLVKGTAVWISDFTPETTQYYGDSASGTELLLHMDGADESTTFVDSSESVTPTNTGNFFNFL